MTYEEALEYIASFAPRGWRLGLDRMDELARRAGLSDCLGKTVGPKFIHVAGTNGKGSVTSFVHYALIVQGFRTGGFFSPYVFSPRERIQVDGEYISPEDLARWTTSLAPIAESLTGTDFGSVTEFEFKTAMGLALWKERECEWVALEVGLGGRLDATNIVTPAASIITSISLDHTAILGETESAIAFEKAGIIKPGIPAVAGRLSLEAMKVVVDVCRERDCQLWRLGHEVQVLGDRVRTPRGSYAPLMPALRGSIQVENAALAVAGLDAAGAIREPDKMLQGISETKLPGRMQFQKALDRRWLLDGAHNSAAAAVLRSSIEEISGAQRCRRIYMLTNMVEGHDPSMFYRHFKDLVAHVHVVPIEFRRAQPVIETARLLKELGFEAIEEHDSVEAGIRRATFLSEVDDLILVTGSFYLVGEVGRLLGISGK